MPDSDTLLRLVLLAVALYVLVAVGLELLPFAFLAAPLVAAVLGFRWLAGVLGTPGAVLTLVAAGGGLVLLGYVARRRRMR